MNPPTRKKVLIIDDEAPVRTTLQRYISLLGHDVILTSSGDEGLASIQTALPDLIFLDITMPGVDGLVVLRTLHEKYEKLPVIMLAATPDIPKANMALNYGAGDYIAKPIDLPTLKRTLQIHLGGTL
jgi:CheY-like chemotaxis protein